ncbi:MAG: hypothetical protein WC455_30150 [Dehalococcoidia bacterium]|jgi:hypothetical protein
MFDLTGAALNRAIAEAQGITCRPQGPDFGGWYYWGFYSQDDVRLGEVSPDNEEHPFQTADEAWALAWVKDPDSLKTPLPDWAHDPGQAYMLCWELAAEHGWMLYTRLEANEYYVGPVVGFEELEYEVGADDILCDSGDEARMANALARLALKTLEGKR